ncbi:helix-turn-helix domain-containing protein [Virgibacillus salexigens]|uniref:helix-turn-helix domain-containing protein n=1 Tax=Virgibacillus salexigens TaxID=61016 RepID=UPI0019095A41|nr:helix-turn-helix domain-containing protein [Virgibacillus salexigens]
MNEKELAVFVGERIKEERKKKGLTQKELGEKIGVKHNTISSYEKGTNAPEQNAIFKIARALNVKVDDLFPSNSQANSADDLQRALEMAKEMDIKDIQLLKGLIEKTLSLKDEEREKFLESIRFTVDFYDNMNK